MIDDVVGAVAETIQSARRMEKTRHSRSEVDVLAETERTIIHHKAHEKNTSEKRRSKLFELNGNVGTPCNAVIDEHSSNGTSVKVTDDPRTASGVGKNTNRLPFHARRVVEIRRADPFTDDLGKK